MIDTKSTQNWTEYENLSKQVNSDDMLVSEGGSQNIKNVPLSERAATEINHVDPKIRNKVTFSDHNSNHHNIFNDSSTNCKINDELRLKCNNLETACFRRSERLRANKEPDSHAKGNIIYNCVAASVFKTKPLATKSLQTSMTRFFYCTETSSCLFDNAMNDLSIFSFQDKHEEKETQSCNNMLNRRINPSSLKP